ncbi:hypothetical protein KSS87_007142 [Heliosperma pusillum]|nr:hypothetical protein KSS87_007142 [Heliosperma pusillum]
MALSQRIRSTIPVARTLISSRNFATAAPTTKQNIKVPVSMFGGCANYASALYIAAAKANALDKVESELLDLVEATKKSPMFSQFTKDLSVPSDTRSKALIDISAQANFTDVMKNFLEAIHITATFANCDADASPRDSLRVGRSVAGDRGRGAGRAVMGVVVVVGVEGSIGGKHLRYNLVVVLAENGRLRHVDSIAKRFWELTMAYRGELKATVTTVIPLPAGEEKELKETLQEILGQGIKVKLEQKIDPNILGGIVVEFGQKVFDMSIRTRARQMESFLSQRDELMTVDAGA